MILVLLAVLGGTIATVCSYVASRRLWFTPFGMFVALFTIIFYLRPLQLAIMGLADSTHYITGVEEAVVYTLATNLVGFVCIVIGYVAAEYIRPNRNGPLVSRTRLSHALIVTATAAYIVGLIAYAVVIKRVGGLGFIWSNLYLRRTLFEGVHEIRLLSHMTYLSSLAIIAQGFLTESARLRRIGWVGVIVSTILLMTWGGRASALYAIMSALVLSAFYIRVRVKRAFIWCLVVAYALVVIGEYRLNTGQGGGNAELLSNAAVRFGEIPDRFVSSFLYYDGQVLMMHALASGQIEHQLGATYIWPILNFIPRRIYEDKPPSTVGGWLKRATVGQDGGYPVGFVGESYLNFGWPGVILLGGILGAIISILRKLIPYMRRSPIPAVALAITIIRNGSGLADSHIFLLIVDLGLLAFMYLLYRILRGTIRVTRRGTVTAPMHVPVVSK